MSTSLGKDPTEFNINSSSNEPTTSLSEQRKQAALDLAELIYEIFVASEANDSIEQKG